MRSIFEPNASQVIKQRISRLRPDSERQWGKMNAAQTVAHLSKGIEQALGDVQQLAVVHGPRVELVFDEISLRYRKFHGAQARLRQARVTA